MRNFIKYIIITIGLFLSGNLSAQIVHFKAYRAADGVAAKNVVGSYSWGAWVPESEDITIDFTASNVFVGKKTYEIMEKPKKWIIKRDLKYVSISCADKSYNKVNIKLYQYDKGEFRIYVMGEQKAKRYSVSYLDD